MERDDSGADSYYVLANEDGEESNHVDRGQCEAFLMLDIWNIMKRRTRTACLCFWWRGEKRFGPPY